MDATPTALRFRPYFQLVRLPNVFTAAADSLAGWLLVGGTFAEPQRWLPLVLASMAIYAAGIALNDYFDYVLDKIERPGRPLPSGAISRRFALGLAITLFAAGLALAAVTGSAASVATAAALVVCVVAYDVGLRKTVLGPLAMGSCRALDVLLGMSLVEDFGGPAAWMVAAGIGLFVVGLTVISRSETHTGRAGGVAVGLLIQDLGLAILIGLALGPNRFPSAESGGLGPALPALGVAVLALAALKINLAGFRAVATSRPETIQLAVKTGVLSLIWLHVGMVAAIRGPLAGMAVAALWPPAAWLARWIYST